MRCKKHFTDLSSVVGVCASCLRERLFSLIAAQAQAQAHAQAQTQAVEDHRKSDAHLAFPRSVSPYISCRKSDNSTWPNHHQHHQSLSDQRFYSTPQLGPTGVIVAAGTNKQKNGRFSLFSSLFRSKSRNSDSDPTVSVSNSRESCAAATSTSSPSWFSSILPGRRKKQSRLYYIDESTTASGPRRQCRNRDRGMSPARYSEDGGEDEFCEGSSGYSSESSQGWKQTPMRVVQQVRRGGRPFYQRNVSGLAFCLSPLVRANPNRHWNQKGMTPEVAFSGEFRVPVKPHLSNTKSYCANRSRKLADFGRFNPNH